MPANLDRAILLLNQSRHEMAERELRSALAGDPDDPFAHAFLALCLAARGRWEEAGRESGEAVGLAPGLAFAHHVAAKVRLHEKKYDEAEAAVGEAIRIEPWQSSHHALLAAVQFERRRWAEALAAAERGLAADPDDADCVNLRAMALVNLGRKREAGEAIAGALAKDPENALSQANQGWTLLHGGDHRQALEHFREALRIDPGSEWARAGVVEALKARYLIYRLMLRFFLWSSRLSDKGRWVLLAAILFGPRLLRGLGEQDPALGPVFGLLATGVVVFALMTWIADPLFNLLLRLNRFGRLALSREQTVASNWLGLCVLLLAVSASAWLATGSPVGKDAAVVFGLLLIPVSTTFRVPAGRPRAILAALTVAVAAAGLVTAEPPPHYLLLALGRGLGYRTRGEFQQLYSQALNFFLLGAIGSTWLAAALGRRR